VALQLTRQSTTRPGGGAGTGSAVAIVQVAGPQVEVASGPSMQQVSIGPPPALAMGSGGSFYDEGIASSAAQVAIASGPDAAQDIDSFY
jgi:hypothetical protein